MAKDYYNILGVDKGATTDEIKKAYRKQALEHHPDRGGDAEKFKTATEAYEVLSDPQKKAQYDQFGSVGGNGGFGGGNGGGGFGGFQGDFSDLGDIFESFFGGSGGGGFGFGGQQQRTPTGPRRGRDIKTGIQLDFLEACFGVEKKVEYNNLEHCTTCEGKGHPKDANIKTCDTCGGTGEVHVIQRSMLGNVRTVTTCNTCNGEGKIPDKKCESCEGAGTIRVRQKHNIKIPAGVDNGTVIKVSERGEAGYKGGPSGDLYAHIEVAEHKKFIREGYSIRTTQKIHVLQAILGDKIEVETIHGKKKVKIPQGITSGQVIKLEHQGVPKLNSSEKGNHLLTVEIDVPKKLSKKERDLYEELAGMANIKRDGESSSKGGLFGF